MQSPGTIKTGFELCFLILPIIAFLFQNWGNIRDGAKYSGVSERTFRKWLKKGLRHSRLETGSVLIRFTAIDEYLEKHSVCDNKTDEIVDEVLKDL